MKKRLLALLLTLVMVVSCVGLLAGCSGSKKDDGLVGDWTATMDMTDGFKTYFNDELAGEIADAGLGDISADDLFDLSRLAAVMEWKMVMGEDETITMTLDAQKFADSMQDVMADSEAKITAAMPTLMEAILAGEGMTMADMEAALAAQGMSLDDLMGEMSEEMSKAFSEGLADLSGTDMSVEESGYYIVDGNKLYVVDNKGDKPNPDEYLEFELKDGELLVTGMSDDLMEAFGEMAEMAGGELLPLTFKRG